MNYLFLAGILYLIYENLKLKHKLFLIEEEENKIIKFYRR